MRNRQWLIDGNPRGRPLEVADFRYHESEAAPLADGEVRVKVEYLSFDPSQKGQLENVSGYASGNEIGDVMRARGLGEVVESRAPSLAVGAKVIGGLGWQELATLPGRSLEEVPDDDLLTARLGPLGTTGLTAYFGLLHIGRPVPAWHATTRQPARSSGSSLAGSAR